MRIWLNNKHRNDEGNMCMCPRCRFYRELEETGEMPTQEVMDERLVIIDKWDNRMDELNANMAKRFPDVPDKD